MVYELIMPKIEDLQKMEAEQVADESAKLTGVATAFNEEYRAKMAIFHSLVGIKQKEEETKRKKDIGHLSRSIGAVLAGDGDKEKK